VLLDEAACCCIRIPTHPFVSFLLLRTAAAADTRTVSVSPAAAAAAAVPTYLQDLVEALTNGEFWLPAHNVWGSPKDKWEQGEVSE
jgi:hypothetical protein